MLTIGDKIKSLRKLKNYTQEYMAYQLNISPYEYREIEACNTSITLLKIQQIAYLLEVNLINLLCLYPKDLLEKKKGKYKKEKWAGNKNLLLERFTKRLPGETSNRMN